MQTTTKPVSAAHMMQALRSRFKGDSELARVLEVCIANWGIQRAHALLIGISFAVLKLELKVVGGNVNRLRETLATR